MKQYWLVYKEFFKTSIAEATTYRVNFFLVFFVDIAFYASTFASVDFLFSHIDHIGIWNRDQFMFFIALTLAVDSFDMIFLGRNYWAFSDDLKLGNIDFTLLRPIHSLFVVFFRYVMVSSLCYAIVVWPLLIYFAIKVELSLLSWLLLPPTILLSFTLIGLVQFLISTLMFWTIEGASINFLRMQFVRVGRYPDFVYQKFTRKFFTIAIPILIATSAPAHFLLDPKGQWHQILLLILFILIFGAILLKVWKFGLDRYESASS
ncbi:MAG: ABC-2 family transporter protein [Bacteriovoracales bacterium]|nr:ABC-2 family transporter protein [Bacteriovoracales bacterium]